MRSGRRQFRGRVAVSILTFVCALGSAPVALAAPAEIVAADDDFLFVGAPFQQPQGEVAGFTNPEASVAIHNVYSTSRGPDGRELFLSDTIGPGSASPVAGTQYLKAGSYPFVCTLHPGMGGALEVTTSGTPVRRPQLKAVLTAQRLKTVVRKGAIRVSFSSPTGVQAGRSILKVGKSTIATVRSIALAPRTQKVIAAKLVPKGRGVLKGRKSASVAVTASVDFGKPSTSRKVLR